MIVYSLHRGGWKRQRVSWLIPAKNIRIEQFVFVVSNNRLLDFNPFHLLVLLVVFFFQNENIRIRFTLDRDIYIYIYQNHEWEEICGEINHFGKKSFTDLILPFNTIWNRRVKNVSICSVNSKLKYFQRKPPLCAEI